MKVTFCAYDLPNYINGPNVWLQRLLPELRSHGVEGKILFLRGGDNVACQTIQALQEASFVCEIYRGLPYTEHQMRWILERVKSDPPDVFVPNLVIPAYFASHWIKEAGIPTVGVLHSDDSFYRAVLDSFVRAPTRECLSAVVCVSKFLESLANDASQSRTLVQMIPYGVPVPTRTARSPENGLRMVYAGRLVDRQKRITDTVRSLCRVVKELTGSSATLFGSGPAETDVREIIRGQGCAESVKIGGLVGHREIQSRMLEAHILVLLSDYEGLPIVLMDAMACGLVPVCFNMRSGIPELVEDGVTGLLVSDRGDEFVAALRRLCDEKQLFERLSCAARGRIVANYSLAVCVRDWITLFENLRGGASAKRGAVVQIPRKFDLPNRHPDIDPSEDWRWPGYLQRQWRRAKESLDWRWPRYLWHQWQRARESLDDR